MSWDPVLAVRVILAATRSAAALASDASAVVISGSSAAHREGIRQGSRGVELADVGEGRLDRPDRVGGSAGDAGMDDVAALDRLDGCIDRLTRERVRVGDDLLGEGVSVVGDARFEGHAADRGASVRDDPLDGVAFASDGQGLGQHGIDIRPAADVGVADGGLPGRAGQDDLALASEP